MGAAPQPWSCPQHEVETRVKMKMNRMSADEILAALEAARTDYPDLAPFLEFRRDLLVAQSTVDMPSLSLDEAEIRTRLQRGQPALLLDDLALDGMTFAELLWRVEEVTARYRSDWPTDGAGLSLKAARAWFVGDEVRDEQTAFLIGEALRPFLMHAARKLHSVLAGVPWHRPICPVCGGAPDFAVLEREAGARILFCSRCDTGWRFGRAGCPFCEGDDYAKFAYFLSDDGAYRLYVCDACQRYLKAMDLRETGRVVVPVVERAVTVGMDVAACEEGYR